MGRIIRVKLNWTGFAGGPGYTNLFFEPIPEADPITQARVDAAAARCLTFVTAIKAQLPDKVTVTVDPSVDELDEVTGKLQTVWTATTAGAGQVGALAATFAAGVGYVINWTTEGVRNSRRVRGRTFIAPIASNAMDVDGSLNAGNLTSWRAAATALRAQSDGIRLVIWARPNEILPLDGGAYFVSGSTINDRVAYLSSRRS